MRNLINFEKNIDRMLDKKRLDIQEILAVPALKLKAVLRIHIYTVFLINKSTNELEFEVRLVGRILVNKNKRSSLHEPKKMSNFIKVIQFIVQKNPEKVNSAHWQKQVSNRKNNHDGFIFRGVTEEENTVTIKMMLDTPHIYKINPELEQIIKCKKSTRQNIIASIWEYIKANNLLDKEKKNLVNCDSALRQIFKQDTIPVDMISLGIKDHVSPLDPIQIDYSFKKNSTIEENEKIYDIQLEIDPPFTVDTMPFFVQKLILENKEKEGIIENKIRTHPDILINEKIKGIERSMVKTIEKIHDESVKELNYKAFHKNPALFIENLILQQNKLLSMIKNHDLKQMNDKQLDERSLMDKLLTEYQDLAYDEIKKFTTKMTEYQ